MKVKQTKNSDGKLICECVASVQEVDRAFQAAHLGFAQQRGLQPVAGKSVADVAKEKFGINDLDFTTADQAMNYLVPFALSKNNIAPAFQPKVMPLDMIKRGEEYRFRLEVTPKPEFELSSYGPLEVTIRPFTSDEGQVDEQIAQIAKQSSSYENTDEKRPVEKGDHVFLAIKATRDGNVIDGLTTDGRTYSTCQGFMPEVFDDNIIGMNVGETKTFKVEGPGVDDDGNEIVDVIECTVTVKALQEETIPTITDEWLSVHLPMYKSLEDLRTSISGMLDSQQKDEYEDYKRQAVTDENSKRFEGKFADELYEATAKSLHNQMLIDLQQQGMNYDEYVKQQGGEQQLNMMMMMQTRQVLVQGYALDSVYRHEKLAYTDADILDACSTLNPQNPKMVKQQMEDQGMGFALREMAERMRASKYLVEHAKFTYAE